MNPGWILLAGGLVALAALFFLRSRKKTDTRFETVYMVYISEQELPSQEALMDRMIAQNPFNSKSKTVIGSREGLLFTDIRLYLSTADRDKNPMLFRPDLMESEYYFTPEALKAISGAHKVALIRYVLTEPAGDLRHLTFVPHMAMAISDLCGGVAIADATARSLKTSPAFADEVRQFQSLESLDAHVRLTTIPVGDDFRIASYGLRKLGLPDFTTSHLSSDMLTTGMSLCEEYLAACWNAKQIVPTHSTEQFGAKMVVVAGDSAGGFVHIRLMRESSL